jgi:hypothetical protein
LYIGDDSRPYIIRLSIRGGHMKSSKWNTSRFVVGLLLVVLSALMLLFANGNYPTAGIIGIGVLGLISIAISRKK